jgi:pilus assembly protein CpaB
MKIARLAVLGIALAAGVAAAFMINGSKGSAPAIEVAAPAPVVESEDVLVAAHALDVGALVGDSEIRWQSWPKRDIADGMIRKNAEPNAFEDIKGSVSRGEFFSGEPMRREKLVKGPNSGFLSAILPSGFRAVAINIDTAGGASAGGFILPNDRVDVLRTFRDDEAGKQVGADVFRSETILTNVRVLAIGTNVQEKNGDHVVQGSTATLEVDPRQAEQLVLAQRVGQLSLALRSMADAAKSGDPSLDTADDKAITIVRYGVASQSAGR